MKRILAAALLAVIGLAGAAQAVPTHIEYAGGRYLDPVFWVIFDEKPDNVWVIDLYYTTSLPESEQHERFKLYPELMEVTDALGTGAGVLRWQDLIYLNLDSILFLDRYRYTFTETTTAVPLPASGALLVGALGLLGWSRRKRVTN